MRRALAAVGAALALAAGCGPRGQGTAPAGGASPAAGSSPVASPAASASPAAKSVEVAPEVERYGKAYTAVMTGFRDDMLAINKRHPLPPEPAEGKPQTPEYRRQVLTVSRAATADIAERTAGWVKRLEKLSPPPQMKEFHAANVAMLRAQGEGNRLLSESLTPGLKKEERERVRQKAERVRDEQIAATRRVVRAVESAGGTAPESVRRLITELEATAK